MGASGTAGSDAPLDEIGEQDEEMISHLPELLEKFGQ
jgi:hypothetical protein